MGITFLFGSGADSDYCSNLPSGVAFSGALLTDRYKKQRELLLPGKASRLSLVRPNSINVFLKTIEAHPNVAEEIFGKDCVEKCVTYYNTHTNELQGYIHKICREWYSAIIAEDNSPTRKFFLENATFFDSLDVKFNSLRNMPLNDNACRVINAYFTVFVLMLHALYDICDDFEWSWDKLFDLLKEDYDCLKDSPERLTYYQALASSKLKYNVVTTNYTSIAQRVTQKKDSIYLHGKMTWFEDYRNLTVYDCEEDGERKLALQNQRTLFPFILIPSGVKPLICKKQIEEFHKFVSVLNDSETLCVVGYRFNSEDNHINSIIAEWLRSGGKQLVYFNYDNCLDFSEIALFEPFSRRSLAYNSQEKMEVPAGIKIIDIPITKTIGVLAFQDYLKQCTAE